MDSYTISLVLGLWIGGMILDVFRHVVSSISIGKPITDAEREVRRQRAMSMSRKKKVGIIAGFAIMLIGLIMLVVFAVAILLPTPSPAPEIVGYYPVSQPMPKEVGMYLGIGILVIILDLFLSLNLDSGPVGAGGIKQAVKQSFSLVNLVGSLAMPAVIYTSLLIGSRQVPLYDYGVMEGIHPAEFAGVVKASSVVFVSVFILWSVGALQGMIGKWQGGRAEQAPHAGAEQGKIDSAAAGVA